MKTLRSFLARLRDLFRRKRMEAGLREDLDFHLSELEEKHKRRGLTAEEATAAARRELGNVTRVQEDFHEQAGFPLLEELARDFAVALRGLVKRPVFSLGVVAILALGLGIAATVRGLAVAVFNRPLEVGHPEEIHLVLTPGKTPARVSRGTANRIGELFGADKTAAYSSTSRVVVRRADKPAFNASAQLVSGSFFGMLGVAPEAGRLLAPDDEGSKEKAAVAVVSHAWALRNFNSVERALGQELLVKDVHVRIVGVAPASFIGILPGRSTDLWLPAALQPDLEFSSNSDRISSSDRPNDNDWNREERVSWLNVFMRLKPGADLTAAGTKVVQAYRVQGEDLAKALQDGGEKEKVLKRTFAVAPAPAGYSSFRDSYEATNTALTAFVSVFLLLAAANVSGLLLVRGMSRQREIGVRLALGAKRWRIFFLLGSESFALSAGGALAGLSLASWLLPVAARLLAPTQNFGNLSIDLGVFGLIALLALAIALLCSLLPSYFLTRLPPQDAILGQGRLGRSPVVAGQGLVALQLGSAVVLVALAIALGSSLSKLLSSDPGFSRSLVLAADFDPVAGRLSRKEAENARRRLESVLLAVPQVESVNFATGGLVSGSRSQSHFYFRGDDALAKNAAIQTDTVLPGFFKTAGMILVAGRDFDGTDKEGAPLTAIVTQSFARKIFGSDNVLGRRFGFGPEADSSDCTIVGIVADAKVNGLREASPPMIFMSHNQWPDFPAERVHVRVRTEAPGIERVLQEACSKAEPGLIFSRWQTLESYLNGELVGEQGASRMSYAFAFAALLLAATGMGALTAYLVTQRSREFAVRMAVGADPFLIRRGVIVESLRLGALGVVLGLAVAVACNALPAVFSRLPVHPDFLSTSIASACCLLAIVLAGWLPAMRAARADPLQLLKSE